MSSKFIPPKVGSSSCTARISSLGSLVLSSISNTSISANLLNNTPFPSITGFPAAAPISPKPSTAVPFDTTATRLPFAVYK